MASNSSINYDDEGWHNRVCAKRQRKGTGPRKLVFHIFEWDGNWEDMECLWNVIKDLTKEDALGYYAAASDDFKIISIHVSIDDCEESNEKARIIRKLKSIDVKCFKMEVRENC